MTKQSKFRKWLYDNNLFIYEFAVLIQVDRSSLLNWMKGRKRPSVKSMRQIRKATNNEIFDPQELLDQGLS